MSPRAQKLEVEGPIHFVGIGGSGMSGLAELALLDGIKVSGSDTQDTPALARLRNLGAAIHSGHDASYIGEARTVVYSTAIPSGNAELAFAEQHHLKILHRSDFLALLLQDKLAVTVAGTHGKTTTSAMIGHMLAELGLDPSVALGGTMKSSGSSARAGKGELFVAEADESDGSFLKYQPHIAVLTNVDLDHMDFFKDRPGLIAAFRAYLGNVHEDGTAVVGWDSPLSREAAQEITDNRLTYGFLLGCEVRGYDYGCAQGVTSFSAMVERDQVLVRLPMLGKHNAQNALAALTVARALELDVRLAAAALAGFRGVERRMSHVFHGNGIEIFDDYAHNPGKIAAAIQALKTAWPASSLHVVYQAHRYSRLETMYDEMLEALRGADSVHVVPVYSAGETTSRDFSPAKLALDLGQKLGAVAHAVPDFAAAAAAVKAMVKAPAVILTVGAGDVWKIGKSLSALYDAAL